MVLAGFVYWWLGLRFVAVLYCCYMWFVLWFWGVGLACCFVWLLGCAVGVGCLVWFVLWLYDCAVVAFGFF